MIDLYEEYELGKFKPLEDKPPVRVFRFEVLNEIGRHWMNMVVHGYRYYRRDCWVGPPELKPPPDPPTTEQKPPPRRRRR